MSTALAKHIPHRREAAPSAGVVSVSDSPQSSNASANEKDTTKVGTTIDSSHFDHGSDLGAPADEKRFWWQRGSSFDSNAIATQPSVFDDPDSAKQYQPPGEWENIHRFDPSARWTWGEEYKVIRKIDLRIMVWACVMFMCLELDRANIGQAVTDNFLKDLKMNTNDFNLGNTVFKLSFLCAELPSQLISKWVGPDRWIPAQMVLWSLVASFQFFLSGRTSFLACRSLLGLLQGGFIPDVILYLSYFYKHHELSLRLGFFWTAMSIADILAAFFAFGLLRLRGLHGYAGWRWLFLIEGLITLAFGLASFILMPASPTQTAGNLRGKKGWFSEREEVIMINRVIREDPTKSYMHNREPITPVLLWKSMKDYDLWPLYVLGLMFQIPMGPPNQYLTLTLRGLGFDTFKSNLLVIPSVVFHCFTMLGLTYIGEVWGELTFTAMIAQVWAFPFLVLLYVTDIRSINKWTTYAITTLLLSYPSAHPIQVAWNSRNSNSVRSRTVSAALYNMHVQTSGIILSNIYRADDAPRYKRGNRVLLSLCVTNMVLYGLTKLYYVKRNQYRDRKWNALTEDQRVEYLATTTDEGNKRLDFRFAH